MILADFIVLSITLKILDSPWQRFGLFVTHCIWNAIQTETKFTHINIRFLVEPKS
jgi:hypothetical protein